MNYHLMLGKQPIYLLLQVVLNDQEYGRENIRANAIAPGTIETPLVDNLAGTSEDEAGHHTTINTNRFTCNK
jgi:NAD(P)-dependent dehydrogenase (short-subunit alcohol dehydrogenase family)